MRPSDVLYHRIYKYKPLKALKRYKRRYGKKQEVVKKHLKAVNDAIYMREELGKAPSVVPLRWSESRNRWWERDRQRGRVFRLKLKMRFWTRKYLASNSVEELQRKRNLVREVLTYDFLKEKERTVLWKQSLRVVNTMKKLKKEQRNAE